MRSRMRITALGLVAGLAGVTLFSSPALAYTRTSYGANYAGVGTDKRWVEVCDMEADGRGVHGEFRLTGGGVMTKGDANGSAGGCGNQTAGANITSFRVCEANSGCSVWTPVS
ncbi:hypothetical protein ABZ897_33155 [Nonomuraea sp. NPDC046802]|uniref:hypothetical protein n=1 Tax=Nonomuraea sp. NPDC046802 TaxID=3154919 RepID=UPI0033F5014D